MTLSSVAPATGEALGIVPIADRHAVLAAVEEAGAVQGLQAEPPFLVFDIGGGSTEFVVGSTAGVDAAISVDIGCVRMTERHLRGDPPTAAEIASAESDITAAVDRALEAVPGRAARRRVMGAPGRPCRS